MTNILEPSLVLTPARADITSGDTHVWLIRYNPDSGPDAVKTIVIDFGDGTLPETHETTEGQDSVEIPHRYEYVRPPRGKYTGKTFFPTLTATGARGGKKTITRAASVTVASK
ncbi:hypothetical protein RJ53_07195 [Methanocalculus chunghsingensis]|uniref:Uncharacterized protein n=1 Tax=Methanocalculus chunghsingensis TaxID=156457 RepID=A0A8J7WAQ6_9EURY|nr:hypothetical protein [Methanocalculus chunghsingensis]MBR1369288.1 hypothetical protein [Methanocalculus chunghsingensis]